MFIVVATVLYYGDDESAGVPGLLGQLSVVYAPFISFKNTIIQAIAMTHEQDN